VVVADEEKKMELPKMEEFSDKRSLYMGYCVAHHLELLQ
jgi:hypothetical protein